MCGAKCVDASAVEKHTHKHVSGAIRPSLSVPTVQITVLKPHLLLFFLTACAAQLPVSLSLCAA